ncbi:MAG TPA: thiamine pyrophosphate-dependent enzyme [Gaiellaceae bacterium]|nr:thiamine pyrophosphate-dependent enzyme [Gaiellaceae bacterium]
MSGGDAIVQTLLLHGVDTVFGLPGVQTYGLFDALARTGSRIRVVCPRHEQTAGYMAYGYAKSTGRAGVYAVVPGAGVLNSAAALSTAYGASTPVVCVTGQVPSRFLGSGKGHLHELPDQLATLRTLTKWAARIETPAAAPALVAEAFRQAATGRPRAVAVEMPWDVFDAQEPVELPPPPAPPPALEPDAGAIEAAAELLRGARRPLIMVGGGAVEAAAEVLALAELLQAPVVSFRGGRGVVSDDHPLGLTCVAGFELWPETDVLLGIGSRLELAWFRWPDRPAGLRVVNVDVDPLQAERLQPDVAITADAAAATRALVAALEGVEREPRHAELRALKERTRQEIEAVRPHAAFLAAIREALPRDGFLVEELCQAGFASYFAFPVYAPRTFVTGGHQGALGFGFPTALGVKVAHPDRAVVSITGDGGFLFGATDLATAGQEGIGVVTIVFDNGAYGNVLRDQQRLYDGRVLGAVLRNPDFLALAASFGIPAARADTPDELRRALGRALADGGPWLIEVPVDPSQEVSPWPFLMPRPRRR